MPGRINTVMQPCFFALADVMEVDDAIGAIKASIEKAYGRKGGAIIAKNFAAVDAALEHLHEVSVPSAAKWRSLTPWKLSDQRWVT